MTREHPGQLLKALRKELGMRQAPFAQALGISQGALSKIEAGKLEPRLHAFRKAAAIVRDMGPGNSKGLLQEYRDFIFGE
jgi:transcriptional regulator with XRE-family HTH domain